MIIRTEEELEALKTIGRIVAITMQEMVGAVKPGMTTGQLDAIGGQVLSLYHAKSAPQITCDFPGVTCICVNDEVAHGIPGDRIIEKGDTINIDVSAELDGFFADHGMMVMVPPVDDTAKRLCNCSKRALERAISVAVKGNYIANIGKVVEEEAKKAGFTTVKNLYGHGVGRTLHDSPDAIPNYFNRSDHRILPKGVVLAIEPFVSEKDRAVIEQKDGWTLKTPHRSRVAQYEHTIVVRDGAPLILTKC